MSISNKDRILQTGKREKGNIDAIREQVKECLSTTCVGYQIAKDEKNFKDIKAFDDLIEATLAFGLDRVVTPTHTKRIDDAIHALIVRHEEDDLDCKEIVALIGGFTKRVYIPDRNQGRDI